MSTLLIELSVEDTFRLVPSPLLQVSSLSRPLLVERVSGLAAAGDLRVPSLPALAVIQVTPHTGGQDNTESGRYVNLKSWGFCIFYS